MTDRKEGLFTARVITALSVTILFWASAFVAIRASLAAYSPEEMASFRFIIASLTLVGITFWKGLRKPELRDVPGFFAMGFLSVPMYHILLNHGEKTVTAGSASFIINTTPIFTALLATLILKEHLGIRGWIGIGVSIIGAGLLMLGEGGAFHLETGALLILIAAVGNSVYFVILRPFLRRYTPLECATYSIWSGVLFLLPWAPGLPDVISAAPVETTAAVIYLGIFPGAIAYITWGMTLSAFPASRAATFLYSIPAFVILIGWIWLGELPSLLSIAGGIVALSGVFIVNTRRT